VPKIAIIQDGTEVARQTYADVNRGFEDACELLSRDGLDFSAQVSTDEAVAYLLDGIDPEEYACVVFASNALLSGQIDRALQRHRSHVLDYMHRGGGIVVLHQFSKSLSSVLPEELDIALAPRTRGDWQAQAVACDADDILLHFPACIDVSKIRDGMDEGPPSLFYIKVARESLPKAYKPVLSCGDELLIVRTYDHVTPRIVVATMPLDWQRCVGLLAGAIRYACFGPPRRLVWRQKAAPEGQLIRRWLCTDGGGSVRDVPEHSKPIDDVAVWLLAHVDLCVMPRSEVPDVEERYEVRRFLDRGGTMIAADPVPSPGASRVVGLVGRHAERHLASRLGAELRAVKGWETVDRAFEIRNIVSVLSLLEKDRAYPHSSAVVMTTELAPLRDAIRRRLRNRRHREDLSSSLALAETLAYLEGPTTNHTLVDWMSGVPRASEFDVALQIRAMRAFRERREDVKFLGLALKGITDQRANLRSLGPVARVLDAVAFLDQDGLLGDDGSIDVEHVGHLCNVLEAHVPEPEVGWVSVEATADIIRGLLSIIRRLPQDSDVAARASDLVAIGFITLQNALPRYERSPNGVAWLARLSHAMILTARQFPIGLHRLASLDWPDTSTGEIAGERSLLDYLASENKGLQASLSTLSAQLLAARVGRITATLLVTGVVAALLSFFIYLIGVRSALALLSDVIIVFGVGLAALQGLYAFLARFQLLAGPAERMRKAISAALDAISPIKEVRRDA